MIANQKHLTGVHIFFILFLWLTLCRWNLDITLYCLHPWGHLWFKPKRSNAIFANLKVLITIVFEFHRYLLFSCYRTLVFKPLNANTKMAALKTDRNQEVATSLQIPLDSISGSHVSCTLVLDLRVDRLLYKSGYPRCKCGALSSCDSLT